MASEIINKSEKHIVAPKDIIPLGEKLLYGASDIFGNGMVVIVSMLILVYFNKIIGIGAGIASTIIMLAKIWDAISDPLMGNISDNSKFKMGRRKPFMLIGGALVIPALAFLFAPITGLSNAMKIVFCTFSFLTYCTISTISQVPYMAMAGEISCDHIERDTANVIKLIFGMASAGLSYLIPSALFDMVIRDQLNLNTFYIIMVFGFGIVFSIPLIVGAFAIKERTPYEFEAKKKKFSFKSYTIPLKVKSFRYHLGMYITAFICMDIIAALAVYYCSDVLRGVELFGQEMTTLFVITPMMVVAALMLPVCYRIMKKHSKQYAFRVFIPVYVLGALGLAVYPTSFHPIIVPISAVLMGIGLGGIQMIPWLIFPDTVDVAELKLGIRDTGSFSGLMTFTRKLATAIAIFLVGWGLSLSGLVEGTSETYRPDQPDSAIVAIRVMVIASTIVLMFLAFYFSKKYNVNNEKLLRISYFLNFQRENNLDALSDNEKQEMQALIEELG